MLTSVVSWGHLSLSHFSPSGFLDILHGKTVRSRRTNPKTDTRISFHVSKVVSFVRKDLGCSFTIACVFILPAFFLTRGNGVIFKTVCCFYVSTDDHTRVTLAELDGCPGSDYINANFIDVSAAS